MKNDHLRLGTTICQTIPSTISKYSTESVWPTSRTLTPSKNMSIRTKKSSASTFGSLRKKVEVLFYESRFFLLLLLQHINVKKHNIECHIGQWNLLIEETIYNSKLKTNVVEKLGKRQFDFALRIVFRITKHTKIQETNNTEVFREM